MKQIDADHRTRLDRKLAELPMGRLGRVAEAVPVYVVLASEGGSYFVEAPSI